MHVRTQIGSALVAASLVVALAAAPVLAAGGPRLVLSPGRGSGLVTMTMKNCATPQLWVGGGFTEGAGDILWAYKVTGLATYLPATGWIASGTNGTTWTSTFTAYGGSGKYVVTALCGWPNTVTATFTLK